jgi:hypothetical protein
VTPEEIDRMTGQLRENLIQAGMVPNRIEAAPLQELAKFIHESRLALGPFPLAIAYQAISWFMKGHEIITDTKQGG